VARLLLGSRARIGVPSAFSRACTSARACAVVRSRRERKLNMPDSISQSTATVLRINGREMSYCAIFVRDLGARSLGHRAVSTLSPPAPRNRRCSASLLRKMPVSFIPSPLLPLPRPRTVADIAVTRPANAPAFRVSRPPPFRPSPPGLIRPSAFRAFFPSLFFSPLFFSAPSRNGDYIGIEFFSPRANRFFFVVRGD